MADFDQNSKHYIAESIREMEDNREAPVSKGEEPDVPEQAEAEYPQ